MRGNIIKSIYETKYKPLPVAVKAVLWFTACSFLLKGLGFISAPVFTRLIPEDEYGQLAIMYSYEAIFLTLATWDIHTGAYQRGFFRFKDDIKFFTNSTIALINILTILLFAILFVFNGKVTKYSGISVTNLTIFFVYALTFPAYQMWTIRKRSEFAYKSVVGITTLYAVVGLTVGILAVILIVPTANVRFGAGLVCSIAFCIFFYISSISPKAIRGRFEETKRQWIYCLKYQGPLLLHSLSYLVLNQADRIMIGEMVGKSQTAFYSVAYNLAMAIIILQTSMEQSLQPWRFIKMEEKNYKQIGDSSNLLLVVVGVAIFLFVLVSPEIMKLLFTENYYEAVWSIPPVAASVFFICLYNIFVNIETFFEKTIYVMIITVVCGGLNILMNYIAIPWLGYIACGYTTLLSYVLFAVFHYAVMRFICKKEIPGVNIFSGKIILLISCFFFVACVSVTLLYYYPYLRYSLLFLTMLVAYMQKNKLVPFFSLLRKKG